MPIDNQDFRNRKQQMLLLLKAIEDLARERGKSAIGDALRKQADHLRTGELNVVVCGECRRGKSSLLNAFLETDGICPVDAPVTTNAITRIAHGETERITVVFEEGGKHRSEDIPKERILEYVTEEANPSGNGRKVERLEILLPSPKLKDGLVLYDTPGVGSLNVAHTATTYRLIPYADAVLFVGAANEPLATGELKFLKDIAKSRPHLFHVLTKRDVPPDPEQTLATNLGKIEATLDVPEGAVKGITVSSRYKLLHMEDPDPELLAMSGFLEFEAAIWQLLQKGGDILLGRVQSNALLALSQLLPPIEAERAAWMATSKAELDALDAQLSEQVDRGKQFLSKHNDWREGLQERGRKLQSRCEDELEGEFTDIQRILDQLLMKVEDNEYLKNPARIAERLESECSGAFKRVVESMDDGLGQIVSDLRKKTNLNPKRVGVTAETDFSFTLKRPALPETPGVDKAFEVGSSTVRSVSVMGFIGGGILSAIGLPWLGAPMMIAAAGYGVHKGIKDVAKRETTEIKALVAKEAGLQLGQAKHKAARQLREIFDDSIRAVEKSLKSEIQGALDACEEARKALQETKTSKGAEAEKIRREKDNQYRTILSWKKGLEELAPLPDPQSMGSGKRGE